MKKHLLAASMALASFTSFGAGYQLNLQGIRQLAMGGTGTAYPWDASTIFYNPGGLARMKGIQANVSMLAIVPSTAYGNYYLGNTRSVDQAFTPFNIYVGGPVRENSRLALGLGIYTPFGSGIQWNDNWQGKYIVQSIELKSFFFQPTISYKFSDFLSAGIGFVYATGVFDFKQALPVQDINGDDGTLKLHGNANGIGFNAGLHMKFSDRFQMGVTYRSQVTMDLGGGSANFNVPYSLRNNFPNTRFETFLPLPQVASIGCAIKPLNNERLTLQLDLNYTGWNSYDSLYINFAQHTSSLQDKHSPRHYRNTLTTRIGANYKISKVVSVQAGTAYDPTPVTNGYVTPDLPDADHIVVTGGAAIKPMKRFTILAAIEFVSTPKRASSFDYANFSGTYKTSAVTPGIGIYYNF